MMTAPEPRDPQTELAKERNRIAADRTLLAWVRTSISFIGMGFGISQILNFLVARNQIHFTSALNLDVPGTLRVPS